MLLQENQILTDLNNARGIHDSKYGIGSFNREIIESIKTGNVNNITSEGGARDLIRKYTPQQIKEVIMARQNIPGMNLQSFANKNNTTSDIDIIDDTEVYIAPDYIGEVLKLESDELKLQWLENNSSKLSGSEVIEVIASLSDDNLKLNWLSKENNYEYRRDRDVAKIIDSINQDELKLEWLERNSDMFSLSELEKIMDSTTMTQWRQGNLERLGKFFETDVKIKKLLSESSFDASYKFSDDIGMEYGEKLYSTLSSIRKSIVSILQSFKEIDAAVVESIDDTLKRYQEELLECDYDLNKEKKFYQKRFSKMDSTIIEKAGSNLVGYGVDQITNEFYKLVSETESINELLHVIHSYVTHNDIFYKSVPLLDSKINGMGDPIKLYGEENELARSIYNAIAYDLDVADTDIVTLENGKILMMIRDRGHALSFEIDNNDGKILVNYYIPKICNINMVNNLNGVTKVTSDSEYTVGSFEVSMDNATSEIIGFIEGVPTDSDMSIYGGKIYNPTNGRIDIKVPVNVNIGANSEIDPNFPYTYITRSTSDLYQWKKANETVYLPKSFTTKSGIEITTGALYDILSTEKSSLFNSGKDVDGFKNSDIKDALSQLFDLAKANGITLEGGLANNGIGVSDSSKLYGKIDLNEANISNNSHLASEKRTMNLQLFANKEMTPKLKTKSKFAGETTTQNSGQMLNNGFVRGPNFDAKEGSAAETFNEGILLRDGNIYVNDDVVNSSLLVSLISNVELFEQALIRGNYNGVDIDTILKAFKVLENNKVTIETILNREQIVKYDGQNTVLTDKMQRIVEAVSGLNKGEVILNLKEVYNGSDAIVLTEQQVSKYGMGTINIVRNLLETKLNRIVTSSSVIELLSDSSIINTESVSKLRDKLKINLVEDLDFTDVSEEKINEIQTTAEKEASKEESVSNSNIETTREIQRDVHYLRDIANPNIIKLGDLGEFVETNLSDEILQQVIKQFRETGAVKASKLFESVPYEIDGVELSTILFDQYIEILRNEKYVPKKIKGKFTDADLNYFAQLSPNEKTELRFMKGIYHKLSPNQRETINYIIECFDAGNGESVSIIPNVLGLFRAYVTPTSMEVHSETLKKYIKKLSEKGLSFTTKVDFNAPTDSDKLIFYFDNKESIDILTEVTNEIINANPNAYNLPICGGLLTSKNGAFSFSFNQGRYVQRSTLENTARQCADEIYNNAYLSAILFSSKEIQSEVINSLSTQTDYHSRFSKKTAMESVENFMKFNASLFKKTSHSFAQGSYDIKFGDIGQKEILSKVQDAVRKLGFPSIDIDTYRGFILKQHSLQMFGDLTHQINPAIDRRMYEMLNDGTFGETGIHDISSLNNKNDEGYTKLSDDIKIDESEVRLDQAKSMNLQLFANKNNTDNIEMIDVSKDFKGNNILTNGNLNIDQSDIRSTYFNNKKRFLQAIEYDNKTADLASEFHLRGTIGDTLNIYENGPKVDKVYIGDIVATTHNKYANMNINEMFIAAKRLDIDGFFHNPDYYDNISNSINGYSNQGNDKPIQLYKYDNETYAIADGNNRMTLMFMMYFSEIAHANGDIALISEIDSRYNIFVEVIGDIKSNSSANKGINLQLFADKTSNNSVITELPKDFLIETELTDKQEQTLIDQINRFNSLKGRKREITEPLRDGEGKLMLQEGTLIHGTSFNYTNVENISNTGILTGQAVGIGEDCETFYCTDFYRVEKNQTLREFGNKKIQYDFTPLGYTERGNGRIAFVIVPSKENSELLGYDCYRSGTEESDITKTFVNMLGLPFSENASAGSAILYGVPSNYIDGIIVGNEVLTDKDKIDCLVRKFPNAYITTKNGEFIYDPTIKDSNNLAYTELKRDKLATEYQINDLREKINEIITNNTDRYKSLANLVNAIKKICPESVAIDILEKAHYYEIGPSKEITIDYSNLGMDIDGDTKDLIKLQNYVSNLKKVFNEQKIVMGIYGDDNYSSICRELELKLHEELIKNCSPEIIADVQIIWWNKDPNTRENLIEAAMIRKGIKKRVNSLESIFNGDF